MHPAPSLVIFTVLSGAGMGLVFWLGLGLGPDEGVWRWWACAFAAALVAAGGVASVAHLANPRNAWRAFSQWRSSWLSREACFLAVAMGLFGLYAVLWCFAGLRLWGLGLAASFAAVATVHATAMIYAQLRTVPRWNLTPTCHLFHAFALSGGLLTLAGVLGAAGPGLAPGWVLVALVIAGAAMVWWQTSAAGARRRAAGSSIATATGLSGGEVRAFEAPHTGTNYLLREMAYQVGRRHAFRLRRLGALLGFVLPAIAAALAWAIGGWVLVPAMLLHLAGAMALRWLFFAEAEHVQAFYYGYR